MKARHFFSQLEKSRITDAIKSAETGTSGDIVLFITHRAVSDALGAAHEAFTKMHLKKTVEDDSLLIFIAPKSQSFAVVGGMILHDRVGQVWWDSLVDLLKQHFKAAQYTDGLVVAIHLAGRALKEHFPATAIDRTGQSDIVEE